MFFCFNHSGFFACSLHLAAEGWNKTKSYQNIVYSFHIVVDVGFHYYFFSLVGVCSTIYQTLPFQVNRFHFPWTWLKLKFLTSGKSQWSKEACRKYFAAGLYFFVANSATPAAHFNFVTITMLSFESFCKCKERERGQHGLKKAT